MNYVYALILFFSFPALVYVFRQVLWFVYLWQIKEYRIDRVYAHYKYEDQHAPTSILYTVIKAALAVTAVVFLYTPTASVLIIAPALTFFLYVLLFQSSLQAVVGRRLARPKIKSFRNLLVVAGTVVSLALPLFFLVFWLTQFTGQISTDVTELLQQYEPVQFSEILPQATSEGIVTVPFAVVLVTISAILVLATDLLTHPIVILWVILTAPFAEFKRRSLRMRAAARLAEVRSKGKLKVIAVTGSYGKTTTKELLYQILSKKYKTVKTPENKNTAVGVAVTVLNELKDDTEVFIAEMGAYRKGEINDATDVASPDVSMVTAVGEQHLALFGSVENIFHAKYEIVEGLTDGGLAVLNGDNEYCMRMAEQTDNRTVLYYTIQGSTVAATEVTPPKEDEDDHSLPVDMNVYATDIHEGKDGLEFQLKYHRSEFTVSTALKAEHDISNLMAVMIAISEIGLEMEEVVRLVNDTDLEVPYLNSLEGVGGSVIIDDGYNTNVPGFMDALDYLKKYKTDGRRFVITEGLIELGTVKKDRYRELAKKITDNSDGLITSDTHLAESLTGIDSEYDVRYADTDQGFLNHYVDMINEGDVVLIEGRIPPSVERGVIKRAT